MQQPRRWTRPRDVAMAGMLALLASAVRAQCPDGTPPPCGRAASAATKRVNPALDTRAWIVVPFTNVMKAPDLDWLRDASVNLLSLDLGRWTDVKVVPDKRVADLLRAIPGPRAASLSLNDGIDIARRAGAGMLVMGDYYRVGKGARVVANVFDVRTGARVRSIERQATDQDSLLTAFGPIARGVLALPPPADAKLGAVGTTRIDAYQEYLTGAAALNSFDLAGAAKHLEAALALDSTFALAHYKLSLAYSWSESAGSDSTARAHALAALRLAPSLPPRERALIAGRAAGARGEFGAACAQYRPIVARDSSDVEALYLFAECSFHDPAIERLPADTSVARFEGDWNTSISAFRRVLDLDPAYHPAFAHILDALSASERRGCEQPVAGRCAQSWLGIIVRDHDTLITRAINSNVGELHRLLLLREQSGTRQANLTDALRVGNAWLLAAPQEARARLALAHVQLALGQVTDADVTLRGIKGDIDPNSAAGYVIDRLEIAIKLGRGAEARAINDTLAVLAANRSALPAGVDVAFGRLSRFRRAADAAVARGSWPAFGQAYLRRLPLIVMGSPDDSVLAGERAFYDGMVARNVCDAQCRVGNFQLSFLYSWRTPRSAMPADLVPSGDIRLEPARHALIGARDSLARDARFLDSVAVTRVRTGDVEEATALVAADTYLALGDTTSALRMARLYVDEAMPITPIIKDVGMGQQMTPVLWARMMLLRADLAAATRNTAEARTWYARVLDLWSNADPEFQPVVARIRAALASLK